jgi:hypothetical protein
VKTAYADSFDPEMEIDGYKWDNELSGNLLYGFVGRYVGFTAFELLHGAGAAQFKDHCIDQHNPDAMGPV